MPTGCDIPTTEFDGAPSSSPPSRNANRSCIATSSGNDSKLYCYSFYLVLKECSTCTILSLAWSAVYYDVLPAKQWGMTAIGTVEDGFNSPW